jgi:ubiquinone/menaquinone biosynthesis C-methylase UbiE
LSQHSDRSSKQQVAAHWDRRAAHFDEDLGHSIRAAAERAAWDRILDLILPAGDALEALDIGCGTGFLSLELAFRGYRVTRIDFASSMIAQARKKAAQRHAVIRYEEADAEQLPFAAASFDIAVSRHLLWTLPHPERAMDETLLDDSRKLADLARQSGVDVTLEIVPEMQHVFQFLAGTAPEADAAIRRLADWVRPKLGLG